MKAGRGARPANLTRPSICDLHGWPTAPSAGAVLQPISPRGVCGWPQIRRGAMWLACQSGVAGVATRLCRVEGVASLIGRAAAVVGQQAELNSAQVQCGWPASAHRGIG